MSRSRETAPAPEAETLAKPRLHLLHLDGLRGIAATYVLAYHALTEADPLGSNFHGAAKAITSLLTFGHQAVDLFITLSGFCLMLPIVTSAEGKLRGGAREFFKRRARRILPPYYLTIAVCLILIATLLHTPNGGAWDSCIDTTGHPAFRGFPQLAVTAKDILSHLFLLQDVWPDTVSKIDSVLWSVSVEWRIYLIFPLLVALRGRAGIFKTTAVCLIAAVLLNVILSCIPGIQAGAGVWIGISPQYLGLFGLGMLAAEIAYSPNTRMDSLRHLPWGLIAAVFGVLSFALLKLGAHFHLGNLPISVLDFVVGIGCFALLIASSRTGPNRLRDILSAKPLVKLGLYAYSIYLLHFPLLEILLRYGTKPLGLSPLATLLVELIVGTPLILAALYVFFLYCERPFMSSSLQIAGLPKVLDWATAIKGRLHIQRRNGNQDRGESAVDLTP